jgi:membrane protease YdiL (CAAX protease family)
LRDRPAAGLYVLAWLLSLVGVGLLFVAAQAGGTGFGGVLLMAALLLLLGGLSSAAGYQVVIRSARPEPYFRGPSPLILFGVLLVLTNIVSLVLLVLGVGREDTGATFLVNSLVLLAGYLFVVGVFGFRSGALTLRSIGWPVGESTSRLLVDVVIGAGLLFVVAILDGAWGTLLTFVLGAEPPNVLPAPTTSADIAFMAIGACLLIPIGEELLFRGYSVTAWLRDMGERSALIRSTAFFAFVHIVNIAAVQSQEGAITGLKQATIEVLVIAPVGLALGWLFLRRGLLAAIAGHAAFNLLGVLGLLLSTK